MFKKIKILRQEEIKMKTKITWFDRIMAAVTFAEANEQDTGKRFLAGTRSKPETTQKCRECDTVLASDMHGAEVHS
jgi:hypothetical protein